MRLKRFYRIRKTGSKALFYQDMTVKMGKWGLFFNCIDWEIGVKLWYEFCFLITPFKILLITIFLKSLKHCIFFKFIVLLFKEISLGNTNFLCLSYPSHQFVLYVRLKENVSCIPYLDLWRFILYIQSSIKLHKNGKKEEYLIKKHVIKSTVKTKSLSQKSRENDVSTYFAIIWFILLVSWIQ